jgi:predicted DCC family thiol-disulfide oxidoreductase YuxK
MDLEIYPLELLYDGECAICRFDIAKLRKADKKSRLVFTDITEHGFNPERYGKSLGQLQARMHARCNDGRIVEGAEVMRLALTAVGKSWLVAPTRWPLLNWITESSYDWFAQHRVELSRRFGGFFRSITPECEQTCCSLKK